MKTMIMSTGNLNKVLNSESRFTPEQWGSIKDQIETIEDNQIKELSQLNNPALKFLCNSILHKRGSIKI